MPELWQLYRSGKLLTGHMSAYRGRTLPSLKIDHITLLYPLLYVIKTFKTNADELEQ